MFVTFMNILPYYPACIPRMVRSQPRYIRIRLPGEYKLGSPIGSNVIDKLKRLPFDKQQGGGGEYLMALMYYSITKKTPIQVLAQLIHNFIDYDVDYKDQRYKIGLNMYKLAKSRKIANDRKTVSRETIANLSPAWTQARLRTMRRMVNEDVTEHVPPEWADSGVQYQNYITIILFANLLEALQDTSPEQFDATYSQDATDKQRSIVSAMNLPELFRTAYANNDSRGPKFERTALRGTLRPGCLDNQSHETQRLIFKEDTSEDTKINIKNKEDE